MNILDGVFLIILLLTLFRGLIRGLVKEVIFILALILSFVAAHIGHEPLQPEMAELIPDEQIAATVAYVLIFVCVMLLVLFLGRVLSGLMRTLMLGWLDRLGGAVMGFFKGVAFCAVIILVIIIFFEREAYPLRESLIAPHVIQVSQEMASFIPTHLKERFWEAAEELHELWQDQEWNDLYFWEEGES